jgi:hypothetical protein
MLYRLVSSTRIPIDKLEVIATGLRGSLSIATIK